MTTEEKALALVNAVLADVKLPTVMPGQVVSHWVWEQALLDAIEAHEADNARNEQRLADQAKAFSDAMLVVQEYITGPSWDRGDRCEYIELAGGRRVRFADFILPEPDPLVKARRQIADRVLRQFGAPASDEDCIGLIVAALEEQAKIERIEQ